jgi:hypothetical protein
MRNAAQRGHRGPTPRREVGKKGSDCGFGKKKKFCDLGIERAEDEKRNSEVGKRQSPWNQVTSLLKNQSF